MSVEIRNGNDIAAKRGSWPALKRTVNGSFPIILFLLAFLPRAMDLVARSTVWHERGIQFMRAVIERNWSETLLAPHPGVITMWLAGLTNWFGHILVPTFDEQSLAQKMTYEMIPLATVIALTIVLAYFLLVKMFDRPVAMVATILLALDPFHIFVSKTLHVDGIVSVFCMISALLLLSYIGGGEHVRHRNLILSGLFGGLALLSKAPSLFLVPYTLLCLGTRELDKWATPKPRKMLLSWRHWWNTVISIGKPFLIWILIAVSVYVLLWPAMWSIPGKALARSFTRTVEHTVTPHPNPLFFLGEITSDDPGPLFYPVNILFKTTAVTLPGFLLGMVVLANRHLSRRQRLTLLLMIAFAFFFTLQMTIGQKKSARYILPAFQFITLVAGIGLVTFVRWIGGGRRGLQNLALALLLLVQFGVSIPRHPYYGTHYNALLGGPAYVLGKNIVAGQEQGEGLDIAAEYLNTLPGAQPLVVGVDRGELFRQHFNGIITTIADDKVDYVVYDRNSLIRTNYTNDEVSASWQSYRDREPKLVVSFDNIPYVWVYKAGPEINDNTIEHAIAARIGEDIRLIGYDLEPLKAQPGETIYLTLYWEAVGKPTDDYTVFTHLLDSSGEMQDQQDNQPQAGKYPTLLWDEGERVQDEYALTIPADASAGPYDIAVGMYQLETLERLPVTIMDDLMPDRSLLISGLEVIVAGD